MNYYSDKRIWITGASSGIGRALAAGLAAKGAKVVITARREELLNEIKNNSPSPEKVGVIPADLSDIDALGDLSRRAWGLFGGLDILICNAGVSQRCLFADTDFETGKKLFDINYFSHVRIVDELLPLFRAQGSGRIVGVSSLSALIPSPLRAYYSSAKHALHGFYDTLRAEIWDSGLRVTEVIPGFIRTDISYNALDGGGKAFGRLDPLQGTAGSPEQAASAILRGIRRGKREIYVGLTRQAVIARFLGKYFPGLLSKILRNMKSV